MNTSLASQLRSKLADLKAQRAALLERYTRSHPSIVAIEAQIEQTRRELAQAVTHEPRSEELRANAVREQIESQKVGLEVEAAGLEARDRLLTLSIAQTEQDFRILSGRLAEKRAQLTRLTREADTARNTYSTLSAKATEAVVAEGMKGGLVRVVDRTGASPVARGTTTRVALAAILGVMAGIVLTFVTEYFGTPTPAAAQVPLDFRSFEPSMFPSRRIGADAAEKQEENASA